MNTRAVFLPKDPEQVLFDVVDSVEQAVRSGCKLYVRRSDQQWAFLPTRQQRDFWQARGWDLFGLPVPVRTPEAA